MDEIYPAPPRPAWNWGGCLVLVIILTVLVGMLLPLVGPPVKSTSWQAHCGKNQSQLLGALVAYSTEFEVAYPGPIDPSIGLVTDARRARQVTHQLLWMLARHQSLPASLLTCPKSKFSKATKVDGVRPSLTWGIEPASAVYAFDWASPADPPSSRPVFADRDTASHQGKVMVAFGDAHVQALRLVEVAPRKSGILVTEGPDGQPVPLATAIPVDDQDDDDPSPRFPDDIYTNEHDGSPLYDASSPGQAHSRRAWVK